MYSLNGDPLPSNWTIIHNCSIHFLKRVADKIKEIEPLYKGNDFILDCMTFMVQCRIVTEMNAVFMKMASVLLTPFVHVRETAAKDLKKLHCRGFTEFGKDDEEDETKEPEDTIYKSSPFYTHYLEILNKSKSDLIPSTECTSENVFQSIKIAHYITDHYLLPYATLWSGIIIQNLVHEISHLRNQHVESHFHTVKHTVLEGTT